MNQDIALRKARLTTPRAAALAGIVFSVLLITSLVLIRISVPADPQDAGDWLAGGLKTVTLALNMVPFAGIAFLWFIGVLRDRIGEREDRFFATVFLGSGLLFLSTLFTATATAGGLIGMYGAAASTIVDSGIYAYNRAVTYEIMNVYAMKMAGVFMISTCTLSLRTGIIPRWMSFLGLVLALFLLFSIGFFAWASLVFPLWVLLISVYILLANIGRPRDESKEIA
jgi:hypothetical protein